MELGYILYILLSLQLCRICWRQKDRIRGTAEWWLQIAAFMRNEGCVYTVNLLTKQHLPRTALSCLACLPGHYAPSLNHVLMATVSPFTRAH